MRDPLVCSMWEHLRWAPLVAVGNHRYTVIDTPPGAIRVCSPGRSLPLGNSCDRLGTIGNRWLHSAGVEFPLQYKGTTTFRKPPLYPLSYGGDTA
jgi:hypothetical protein